MKNLKKENIRVRFAPSPTGYLHIGNLRAAIFNWLFARHHGGKFLLRVEDTDRERSKQEYKDYMLDSLQWMGMDYDELVTQSEHIDEHKKMIDKLIDEGKAYRCYCTQEEIEQRKKDNLGHDDLFAGYDGFCAHRTSEEDTNKPYTVRFKLPKDKNSITFDDLIRGPITFELDQFDDFIIARSDGTPMYNLVAVVDDNFMKITHIIRGEDHISNTPKQIMLYEAFGFKVPEFAHVPLIVGPSGDKLSKRDAAVSVLEYRDQGYLADALFNYLVRLGWSHGDQEIFTKKELIAYFDLDHVGKKGAVFDVDKLLWLNGVYMREMLAAEIEKTISQDLKIDLQSTLSGWSSKNILRLIDLYKERTKTLKELIASLELLHQGPKDYDKAAIEKWVGEKTHEHIEKLIVVLEAKDAFEHGQLAGAIKGLCKDIGIKLVALAQPIRLSLTGTSASPGVFELLEIVGKEESVNRLKNFLKKIE